VEVVEPGLAHGLPVLAMMPAVRAAAEAAGSKLAGSKLAGSKLAGSVCVTVVRPRPAVMTEQREGDHPKQDEDDEDGDQETDHSAVRPGRSGGAALGRTHREPGAESGHREDSDDHESEDCGQKSEAASVSHLVAPSDLTPDVVLVGREKLPNLTEKNGDRL
jgi:hypothetical protein